MELVLSILGGIGIVMAIAVNATTVTRFFDERRRGRSEPVGLPTASADAPGADLATERRRAPAAAPLDDAATVPAAAAAPPATAAPPRPSIRTPDQRVRVFVSSTLVELAEERAAVRAAVEGLRLTPVMFESGARAHPPRDLYRAYLDQSDVFVGVYAHRYGWIAPGESVSGLEDEYLRSGERPKLIYVKRVEGGREPALDTLLGRVRADDRVSYRPFTDADELRDLVADDLATLLSERFDRPPETWAQPAFAPVPGVWGPLFGRERELAQAIALLDDPAVRLVTLVGPGGIGKSRLALELAHRLRARSGDDVAFVGLQGVDDHRLVAGAIAAALGLRGADERGAEQTLEAYLATRRSLVVLDNLEQVVAAAALLARLLEVAPGLTLLVTSRVPLRLSAERCVPLSPLPVDEVAATASPATLVATACANPAVALFVWRARAADPTFDVGPSNAAALLRLVGRLEGWPLAILLAAARVRHLSLDALQRRLDATLGDRLDTLAGGASDLPERQRTIRRTIAWSVDLLSDDARALLRRTSVFVGGADLEAIEAVAGAGAPPGSGPTTATLDALAELVDHGLLQRFGVETGARYLGFELVRESALEQLQASGEESAVRSRHADHFLRVAASDGVALQHGRAERLAVLRDEADNLRSAIAFVTSMRDVGAAAAFARSLWLYWWIEGQGAEHAPWLRDLLGAVDPAVGPDPGPRVRLDLLLGLCACTLQQRDLAAARAALDEAEAALTAVDDVPARAVVHIARAIVHASDGDLEGCRWHAEAARASAASVAWPWAESFGWVMLARAAIGRSDLAEAERWAEAAATLQAAAGDPQSESWARICLAVTFGLAGRWAEAWAQVRVALTNLDALAFHGAAVFALEVAAFIAQRSGAREHAARLTAAASASERQFGSARFEPEAGVVRTALSEVTRDDPDAERAWAEGAALPLDVAVRYALDLET
jgi:predicted ATPase